MIIQNTAYGGNISQKSSLEIGVFLSVIKGVIFEFEHLSDSNETQVPEDKML